MKKGQEWIGGLFALLLTGVLAGIALPAILPGQVTQVTPQVEANEFENKAIVLSNSLISNANLIHSDNRGVFDVEKLSTNMMDISAEFEKIIDMCFMMGPPLPTSLCNLYSYPKTFSLILVKDIENNKGWVAVIPRYETGDFIEKVSSCLGPIDKERTLELFANDADIPALLNLEGCGFTRNSYITTPGFPVSIRYSEDDVRGGWIKVLVVE